MKGKRDFRVHSLLPHFVQVSLSHDSSLGLMLSWSRLLSQSHPEEALTQRDILMMRWVGGVNEEEKEEGVLNSKERGNETHANIHSIMNKRNRHHHLHTKRTFFAFTHFHSFLFPSLMPINSRRCKECVWEKDFLSLGSHFPLIKGSDRFHGLMTPLTRVASLSHSNKKSEESKEANETYTCTQSMNTKHHHHHHLHIHPYKSREIEEGRKSLEREQKFSFLFRFRFCLPSSSSSFCRAITHHLFFPFFSLTCIRCVLIPCSYWLLVTSTDDTPLDHHTLLTTKGRRNSLQTLLVPHLLCCSSCCFF